jgi:hypothetical protein
LKKQTPWFDEKCSELLYQRKQVKFQWLQDLKEINGDNVSNKRREARRHLRKKKGGGCLKEKINVLATKSKNKNIRDMYRDTDFRF